MLFGCKQQQQVNTNEVRSLNNSPDCDGEGKSDQLVDKTILGSSWPMFVLLSFHFRDVIDPCCTHSLESRACVSHEAS